MKFGYPPRLGDVWLLSFDGEPHRLVYRGLVPLGRANFPSHLFASDKRDAHGHPEVAANVSHEDFRIDNASMIVQLEEREGVQLDDARRAHEIEMQLRGDVAALRAWLEWASKALTPSRHIAREEILRLLAKLDAGEHLDPPKLGGDHG